MALRPTPGSTTGIRIDPPLIYAALLGAGLLTQRWRPVRILSPGLAAPIGIAALALGLAVTLWAVMSFRRARTSPLLTRPTMALVTSGPYRFSRNPIYLGYTLMYLGAAFWAGSAWPVILLPFGLWVMYRAVITREEAYLESRFGEDYRAYRRRVRRWL